MNIKDSPLGYQFQPSQFTYQTPAPTMAMDPEDAIDEAHRLWELQAARLSGVAALVATLKEQGLCDTVLKVALEEERTAFRHWQSVSRMATLPSVTIGGAK